MQRSTHDCCQRELMPGIIQANRHEIFDRNIMRQMGELGLLGVVIDRTV